MSNIKTLDNIVSEASVLVDDLKLKWMKVYGECGVCRGVNLNEAKTLCLDCKEVIE